MNRIAKNFGLLALTLPWKAARPTTLAFVTWVNNGFCALALGDDKSHWGIGYSWGAGASNTEARNYALANCRARTTGTRLVLCISSNGVAQEVHR